MLSIFSCNANDLRNKLNELHSISCVYKPDVICITETFGCAINTDSFFHLPNYKLFRQDRLTRGGGGIIIYIRDHLSCQIISSTSHTSGLWEGMTCSVFSESTLPLRIVCMYRTPGRMPPFILSDFIDYFKISSSFNNNFHTIVLGDFNLPKINWDLNLCIDSIDSPASHFLSAMNDMH